MNNGLIFGVGSRSKYGRAYQLTGLQNGSATTRATVSVVAGATNAYTSLTGALTANVLKTILEVNSPGVLNFLACWTADATSRTIRIKVTMDGLVVFDNTSSAIATSGSGVIVVGSGAYNGTGADVCIQPLPYTQGLLIEMASSVTETDKTTVGYNNETWQAA